MLGVLVALNRQTWLEKSEAYDILLNTMLEAIPKFDRKKEYRVKQLYLKYYGTLDLISRRIIENKHHKEMIIYTLIKKVRRARELLKEALEKRKIINIWDSMLPDIDGALYYGR